MIKNCWIECWLRTNSWDEVNHGHGTLHVDKLESLPRRFEVWNGRPLPVYDHPVVDDPLTQKINDWYDMPCERPNKSISEMRVRVWQQPRKLVLYLVYYDCWDWKPILLTPDQTEKPEDKLTNEQIKTIAEDSDMARIALRTLLEDPENSKRLLRLSSEDVKFARFCERNDIPVACEWRELSRAEVVNARNN